jgi:hypothetical protein
LKLRMPYLNKSGANVLGAAPKINADAAKMIWVASVMTHVARSAITASSPSAPPMAVINAAELCRQSSPSGGDTKAVFNLM